MATTKIWPVRDNLKRVVAYAENHLKTANPDVYTKAELQDLHNVLQYASDSGKTALQYFVTGVNCIDKIAYEQMSLTKQRFGKTGGNLAYHAYQSFKPDEVTPEQCHNIGIELAKRIWGDRYEIVVSTHVNTNCCHNHFVINSVSFVDGKKLNNNYDMYFRNLRKESDKICCEYGLSVIEHPASTPTPRGIYLTEKAGEPTRYAIMREDIDNGIIQSFTAKHLGNYLRGLGYDINFSETRKYWTLSFAGDKRATRLERLGENYSNDAIRSRIYEHQFPLQEYKAPVQKTQYRFNGSFRKMCKITGFRALYLHYGYLLGIIPKRKEPHRPLSPEMRMELRKFERYREEIRILFRNKIDTDEQLNEFIQTKSTDLTELETQRRKIYNQMRWAPPDTIQELKQKRDEVSGRIKTVRRELFYAHDISENSEVRKKQIEKERQLRTKQIEPKNKKVKSHERRPEHGR